jgi:hypothetical protein
MSVLANVTTITPSKGALATATNLHVASLSVAAYEYVAGGILLPLTENSCSASYLLTLPTEYRLYRSSDRKR